jgi:hypothetical protein
MLCIQLFFVKFLATKMGTEESPLENHFCGAKDNEYQFCKEEAQKMMLYIYFNTELTLI